MDWTDALVKIGVGACLGFGIITLAKLARRKNTPTHAPGERDRTSQSKNGPVPGDKGASPQ